MLLSNCCGAPPAGGMEEYGICGECQEHCEFLDDEVDNDGAAWFTAVVLGVYGKADDEDYFPKQEDK